MRRTLTAVAFWLSSTPENTSAASTDPNNIHLNRYINIVAYDQTRVIVQPACVSLSQMARLACLAHCTPTRLNNAMCHHCRVQSNFNCDYINANWVTGTSGDKHYIATQGPVPASFGRYVFLMSNVSH